MFMISPGIFQFQHRIHELHEEMVNIVSIHFTDDLTSVIDGKSCLIFFHTHSYMFNTLKPRKKWTPFRRPHFQAHWHEWKCMNLDKISWKFALRGPINDIQASVHIMAWRRPGDKLLSEPMMISLPTQICVTWPQWITELNIEQGTYTDKYKPRSFISPLLPWLFYSILILRHLALCSHVD